MRERERNELIKIHDVEKFNSSFLIARIDANCEFYTITKFQISLIYINLHFKFRISLIYES